MNSTHRQIVKGALKGLRVTTIKKIRKSERSYKLPASMQAAEHRKQVERTIEYWNGRS